MKNFHGICNLKAVLGYPYFDWNGLAPSDYLILQQRKQYSTWNPVSIMIEAIPWKMSWTRDTEQPSPSPDVYQQSNAPKCTVYSQM
jgi:hypothetical protein